MENLTIEDWKLWETQEKQVGKQALPTSTLVVQNSHCPKFSHLANAPWKALFFIGNIATLN